MPRHIKRVQSGTAKDVPKKPPVPQNLPPLNAVKNRTKFIASIVISVFAVASFGLLIVQAQNGSSAETGTGTPSLPQDTIDPGDVENVAAEPGDSEVALRWQPASDNIGVVGYKIFRGTESVSDENGSYNLPSIPVGNVESYRVKNLTNGQKYYFTVVALDAAGNESASYAPETSATPQGGLRLASIEDDGKAPVVKNVKAEDIISVKVVFSEPVRLPEEQPASAFVIERKDNKVRLTVQKAEIDARDSSGATVILTTAPQENVAYTLTAGLEIKDYYGNSIISGTSDTGSFDGSAKTSERNGGGADGNADVTPPAIVAAIADFGDRISLTFTEKIILPQNAKGAVQIIKKGTDKKLEIKNVTLNVEGNVVYITTAPQEATDYVVSIRGITDIAGNEPEEDTPPVTVSAVGSGLRDLIPPEDVTKLIARVKNAGKSLVELRWTGSVNSAGDLGDQILYQSEGKNSANFGPGAPMGTEVNAVEVDNLKPGTWYTFKVATKDTTGNESGGILKSILLPQTGPGMIAAGLTGLVAAWWRKRKKRTRDELERHK